MIRFILFCLILFTFFMLLDINEKRPAKKEVRETVQGVHKADTSLNNDSGYLLDGLLLQIRSVELGRVAVPLMISALLVASLYAFRKIIFIVGGLVLFVLLLLVYKGVILFSMTLQDLSAYFELLALNVVHMDILQVSGIVVGVWFALFIQSRKGPP